jgi:hypothetical protein
MRKPWNNGMSEIKTKNTKPCKLTTTKSKKYQKIYKFRRLYCTKGKGDGREKVEKYHDTKVTTKYEKYFFLQIKKDRENLTRKMTS